MARQTIIEEIGAPTDKVWNLLVDPKEVAFWAPNVRDLTLQPKEFGVDTLRNFRLDIGGKIETLETKITHSRENEMFAEIPVGGSLKLHEKVEYLKIIWRLEPVDAKSSTLQFTLDYEMKGFLNKMLEKFLVGAFTSQYRLWMERLKTYAETGRPV